LPTGPSGPSSTPWDRTVRTPDPASPGDHQGTWWSLTPTTPPPPLGSLEWSNEMRASARLWAERIAPARTGSSSSRQPAQGVRWTTSGADRRRSHGAAGVPLARHGEVGACLLPGKLAGATQKGGSAPMRTVTLLGPERTLTSVPMVRLTVRIPAPRLSPPSAWVSRLHRPPRGFRRSWRRLAFRRCQWRPGSFRRWWHPCAFHGYRGCPRVRELAVLAPRRLRGCRRGQP